MLFLQKNKVIRVTLEFSVLGIPECDLNMTFKPVLSSGRKCVSIYF